MAIWKGLDKYVPWRSRCIVIVSTTLFSLGILSVLVLVRAEFINQNQQLLAKLALIYSAIFPPIWFWVEYCIIWNGASDAQRPMLEEFKYGQEVSRNIWLAFVGLVAALYFQ